MLSRWMPRPSKPLKHRNGLGEFDSHTFPPIRRESNEPLIKRGVCCFYQSLTIISILIHKVETKKVETNPTFQPVSNPIAVSSSG